MNNTVNVKHSHYGKQSSVPQKIKNKDTYDPKIPLLVYTQEK